MDPSLPSDILAIIDLLAALPCLPRELNALERHVAHGLRGLVDADAYIWSKGRHALVSEPPVPLMWLHEGWAPEEISAFMEVASSPEFDQLFQFPMGRQFTGRPPEHLTRTRRQVVSDEA